MNFLMPIKNLPNFGGHLSLTTKKIKFILNKLLNFSSISNKKKKQTHNYYFL